MIEWYGVHWNEVVKKLKSNIYAGLEEDQIKSLQNTYGKNKIKLPKTRSFLKLMISQAVQLWILLLIITLMIYLYLKQYQVSVILLVIVLFNIILTVKNEYKEEKDLKELHKLNLGYARVIREGLVVKILSTDLVPGDIVIIEKGDIVPADMRIIESENLRVNEEAVTGEKFISEKYETRIEDKEISLSEMKNILFKSSHVTNGSATGIVINIGMQTQIASVISVFSEEGNKSSIFYRRLNSINNRFSQIVISIVMVKAIHGYFVSESINQIIEFISSTLFISIPYSMSVVIAILSFIILNKLREEDVILRNIPVIEKLSILNMIITDKVGSFSKNKMKVEEVFCNEKIQHANEIIDDFMKKSSSEVSKRLISIALLCNDSGFENIKANKNKNEYIDEALMKFGRKISHNKVELDKKHKRIFSIPYDTERRLYTTINKFEGYYVANVKGALDSLLTKCTHILKNGLEYELKEEDINAIKNADIAMSAKSLNVLGLAYRTFNYEPTIKENIESNLVFCGLIGLENPLIDEIKEELEKSRKLALKPIIVTEDNKITAYSVGKELGMSQNELIVYSGVELDNMTEEEFDKIVERTSIFSRINDLHKVRIVKLFKNLGYNVGMVGSRLTELPALKLSDVGITSSDSRIIKKISDVYTSNLSFKKLLYTIEDSRKILENIKKVLTYLYTANFSALVFIILAYFNGFTKVITPDEALWFNCVTILLSTIALIIYYKNEEPEIPRFIVGKSILSEKKFTVFGKSLLLGTLCFILLKFSSSFGEDFAKMLSVFMLNIGNTLLILDFIKTKFFKSIASSIIFSLNILLQIAIVILVILFNKIKLNIVHFKFIIPLLLFWIVFIYYCKRKNYE